METKIVNVLNDSSNGESNLLQKNGMPQTVQQQKLNTTKTIILDLRVLNQGRMQKLLLQLQEI